VFLTLTKLQHADRLDNHFVVTAGVTPNHLSFFLSFVGLEDPSQSLD